MSLPETIFAKIKTKRSTQTGVTPNPNSLELGELAVNVQDKRIWIGNPDGGIDPVLLVTPLSGSGPINVSSVNAISFNAANIIDNTVPIGKINRATISGDSSGFLKWNGTAWEFEALSGTGGGETYFAGQGLSLSQNVFSVNAGSGLNFSGSQLINSDPGSGQNIFKNIAVAGQSNVVADNNNDTLTLFAGSNINITTNAFTDTITISATDTNTTYTAGNGLNLTGTTFSVNTGTGLGFSGNELINTAPDQIVTLTQGDNVLISGTYPNFTISSLGGGGGGGGSSYFDFCTYADFFGDLSIFGGNATSQFCEYVGTNGGGDVPIMQFTAGSGIKIENSTISFDPTTVISSAINFDKLGRTGIVNDLSGNNFGLVEWTGSQWRFASPGTGTSGDFYFAGTGLSLDTNNTFSFDPISVQNYSISIQKLTPNTSDPGVLFWNGSAWILQSTETTDGIYQAGNGIQIIENNSALENTWTFSILAGTGLTFSGNNLVVDTSLVPVVNNIGESGFLYWNGFNWEFEDILSSDYIGSVVCLDQLLNVNATNLVNGDFLMYLNGEWINIQLGEYDNGILIIDGGNATLY